MERHHEETYRLLVVLARAAIKSSPLPAVGDLVVETSKFQIDADAIGWLVDHGEATYAEDNTGPAREVWDIVPLRGLPAECRSKGYQRWENANFAKVPEEFVKRAGVSKDFDFTRAEPPGSASPPANR